MKAQITVECDECNEVIGKVGFQLSARELLNWHECGVNQ